MPPKRSTRSDGVAREQPKKKRRAQSPETNDTAVSIALLPSLELPKELHLPDQVAPDTRDAPDSTNDAGFEQPSTETKQTQSDLNSSPIKKTEGSTPQSTPLRLTRLLRQAHREPSPNGISAPDTDKENVPSSSPIRRKKAVVFSDDLVSLEPLTNAFKSPAQGLRGSDFSSPLKSILKEKIDSSRAKLSFVGLPIKNACSPDFWHVGTIVQLSPNSGEMSVLVDGVLKVLLDSSFARKFEVYASLNHLYKTNSANTLFRLFTISIEHFIPQVCKFVKRDVQLIESQKIDPFGTRIINQALKLIAQIMSDLELNNYIPVEDCRWFYQHASEMLSTELSKSLVLSYLVVIKEFRFYGKRKKQIFDNDLPELILSAVLKMQGFLSSSLVTEKYFTLINLIQNFPHSMAKNVMHWLPIVLVNLCDLNLPVYIKSIFTGVQTLMEASRSFIDNKNVLFTVRRFLESPLPLEVKSLVSDQPIIPSSQFDSVDLQNIVAFDFIVSNLEELIRIGQYQLAMDIWVSISLLTYNHDSGYECWNNLLRWLKVHKFCFNQLSNEAKVIALKSWRAMIYNVCRGDLADVLKKSEDPANASVLRSKIKLLVHPLLNVTAVENQSEVIDVLNSLFLGIYYTLYCNGTTKVMHVYWDKIFQPVLANFYLKNGPKNGYMNQLGVAFLIRLLNGDSIKSTNSPSSLAAGPAIPAYNELRCLSSEPILLSEIPPLNPKWAFSRFEKIMQNLVISFKLELLNLDMKLALLTAFFQCIKISIKKKIQIPESIFDIIDNIPFVLKVLLENNSLNFHHIYKLIINLIDAFGVLNLLSKNVKDSSKVFDCIIEHTLLLTDTDSEELISVLYSTLGESYNVSLLTSLIRLIEEQKIKSHGPIEDFIIKCLSKKKFEKHPNKLSLELTAEFFRVSEKDFEPFLSLLVAMLVSQLNESFDKIIIELSISKWTLTSFKSFLLIMHNVTNNHFKLTTLNLCVSRWDKRDEALVDILRFMVENNLDFEIFNLRKSIMKKYVNLSSESPVKLEFVVLWDSYLMHISEGDNFRLLDELLLISSKSTDVKSFVKNRWEKLPLLREEWLSRNEELYWDYTISQPLGNGDLSTIIESGLDADITLDSLSPIKTLPPLRSPEILESSTLEKVEPLEESLPESSTPVKEEEEKIAISPEVPKKKRGRPRKNPIAPKAKKVEKVSKKSTQTQPDFDIHSFTAMLTAKLNPDDKKESQEKTKARRINNKKVDKAIYTSNGEIDVKPIVDDNLQPQEENNVFKLKEDQHSLGSLEDRSSLAKSKEPAMEAKMEDADFDYDLFIKNRLPSPEIEDTSSSLQIPDSCKSIFSDEDSHDIKIQQSSSSEIPQESQDKSLDNRENETHELGASEPTLGQSGSSLGLVQAAQLVIAPPPEDTQEVGPNFSSEVAPNTYSIPKSFKELQERLASFSDTEIASLSDRQRYELETSMLKFMMRMRLPQHN